MLNQQLITADPDVFPTSVHSATPTTEAQSLAFLGPKWLQTTAPQWRGALDSPNSFFSVNLSNVDFVTLFDWLTTVALISRLILEESVRQVDLDILGNSEFRLVDPHTLLAIKDDPRHEAPYTSAEVKFSENRYRLAGFLEALDSYSVLNPPDRNPRVIYPGLAHERAAFRDFYGGKKSGTQTVLMGLQKILEPGHCKRFLDVHLIHTWRQNMDRRFRSSPLFQSDEVWRVLCHELAVNIWEHATAPGFIAARVIENPLHSEKSLQYWCAASFPAYYHPLLMTFRAGLLELCVADAGVGFCTNLHPVLASRLQSENLALSTPDILAFSFDELATSKSSDDCWVSARHALNRILFIVAKYGGALRLRSDGYEIAYLSNNHHFRRRPFHRGFEPQVIQKLDVSIPGSQLQILLPLIPSESATSPPSPRSLLEMGLPPSMKTQPNHPRGHLVPLLERLDEPEAPIDLPSRKRFRVKCEALAKELATERSPLDPLVLDFGSLSWTAPQFESFLFYMQNVLLERPAILIEVSRQLVDEIHELEWGGSRSYLSEYLHFETQDLPLTDKAFMIAEFSEEKYLETFSGIHSTLLGLDRNGEPFLVGVPGPLYQSAFLTLLETPQSIDTLISTFSEIDEGRVRAILNRVNPLFQRTSLGWRITWSKDVIAHEARRAMSGHFDEVAKRCEAWRGGIENGTPRKFYLPWQGEWRFDFLETSRILSRGRNADEAAQRLLYRLEKGLSKIDLDLQSVKVLAAVSAPGLRLATALHRWWPRDPRPAVTDLGYYMMLSDPPRLPVLASEGGIVLIQDVLDRQTMTKRFLQGLKSAGARVLCVLGLVEFFDPHEGSAPVSSNEVSEEWLLSHRRATVTAHDQGWIPTNKQTAPLASLSSVPRHALIRIARPVAAEPPLAHEDASNHYWIEPRVLRPVKYPTLRREFQQGRDEHLDRRDQYFRRFDKSRNGCLVHSGHFVYGRRHFQVAIDIKGALTGEVGEEIAAWVADVCEGRRDRPRVGWETGSGRQLTGDVGAILMPLHSQIHYLWPRVETLLAQRGRRQPVWFLEATLFSGSGPEYRLPPQFRHQLRSSVLRGHQDERSSDEKLRIMIVDDTLATGSTAIAILAALVRELQKIRHLTGVSPKTIANAIDWIRYFTILNQAGNEMHTFLRSLTSLGHHHVPLVFEEYAPFMGIEVYQEADCPICRDRTHLQQAAIAAKDRLFYESANWIRRKVERLEPLAIDSPEFPASKATALSKPLEAVAPRVPARDRQERYLPIYADTGVWRFLELMYLGYPPSEILQALDTAWPRNEQLSTAALREYERFRWAVFEWCIRNWPRVVADSATEIFATRALMEIEQSTRLAEDILAGVGELYKEPVIVLLVSTAIRSLGTAEVGRMKKSRGHDQEELLAAERLKRGIELFFLAAYSHQSRAPSTDSSEEKIDELLSLLYSIGTSPEMGQVSLVRNLHLRLSRPRREADPRWALEVIAESLYRGREPVRRPSGGHELLPRLLESVFNSVPTRYELQLLETALGSFIAAIEDLAPYIALDGISGSRGVRSLGTKILRWLSEALSGNTEDLHQPDEIRSLYDAIDLETGRFVQSFKRAFNEEVENLKEVLEKEAKLKGEDRLAFYYRVLPRVARHTYLCHTQRLVVCLANRAIDPIVNYEGNYRSKIEVDLISDGERSDRVAFRIMTSYALPEAVNELIQHSKSSEEEKLILEKFGAEISKWTNPSTDDFLAESLITVPLGARPKRS